MQNNHNSISNISDITESENIVSENVLQENELTVPNSPCNKKKEFLVDSYNNYLYNNESFKEAKDWVEVEFPTSWGTIRGKQHGTSSRKILGVHGWLDNANTFDCIMPLLQYDCTLVSIDLPGQGKSDHFNNGFIYDPRGYVGAIKKVVNILGWKKFTYLGHSMGAVVGILYCSIYPEDISAFISIDIIKPTSYDAQNYPKMYRKYFDSYLDNEEKASLPPIVYSMADLVRKTIEGSRNSLDAASATILLQRGAVLDSSGKGYILTRDLRAKTYFIGFMTLDAWLAMAEAITAPILIIKAESGHSYESPEGTCAMLAAFKKSCTLFCYHEVPGKHHVHMTHASIIAPLLRCFLQETEAYLNIKHVSQVNGVECVSSL